MKRPCPLGGKNAAAFCALHHTNITPKQLAGRRCLAKHCSHLRRNIDHPYWAKKAHTRRKREARKQRMEAMMEKKGEPPCGVESPCP